jgi:ribosomal protein L40E
MTRLLPRFPGRRAATDTDPLDRSAAPAADAPSTASQAAVPAGAEPAGADAPSFRDRARLRRRLRVLRRVRELGFRDLGGLVFDQHRFDRREPALVEAKLAALAAVDGELRAIERALNDERPLTELREAGVSACARCGALLGSDARFCSSCGASVRGAREVAPLGAGPSAIAPPAPGTATPGAPAASPTPPQPSGDTPLATRLGAWAGSGQRGGQDAERGEDREQQPSPDAVETSVVRRSGVERS